MKAFKMDLAEFKAEAKKPAYLKNTNKCYSNASIRERLSREQMLYIIVGSRARNNWLKAE